MADCARQVSCEDPVLTMCALDALDALDVAHAGFRDALVCARSEHLDLPTPCPAWSVRDLLNHVIGGELRYAMLLAGAITTDVEQTRAADHLGSNPLAACDDVWSRLRQAFRATGALDRTVHHRGGERTGRDLLLMRCVEEAVHGWDLACAIGVRPTTNAELAASLEASIGANRHLWARPGGALGGPGNPAAGSSPLDRLLTATGRART